MDAFELLKADHKKVAELFDRLESARGSAKLNVFKQIKNELELHTHVEETIFYPALEKPEETHDLTLEAYEEHKVVKTLLSELARARSANDEWQAKAKVLRENVEHHVDEEENELFDKADDALSDEEIEALGQRMEAEKAKKQGRPAPKRAVAGSSKSNANRGVLSKLASLVGLGDKQEKRRTPAKQKAAAKSAARAGKGRKKVAARSKTRKATTTSASKRSAAAQGAKRARASRSSSKTSRTRSR